MPDTTDLFADQAPLAGTRTALGPQAVVLRGWALAQAQALWDTLQAVVAQAPFRHMLTPGGQTMSVPLTNCGALGWVSDRRGYRYERLDPDSGLPWPALPAQSGLLGWTALLRIWRRGPQLPAGCPPSQPG